MQSLENVGFGNIPYPIPADLIASGELARFLAYDVTYLRNVHAKMNKQSLSPRVRAKYLSTSAMVFAALSRRNRKRSFGSGQPRDCPEIGGIKPPSPIVGMAGRLD